MIIAFGNALVSSFRKLVVNKSLTNVNSRKNSKKGNSYLIYTTLSRSFSVKGSREMEL